MTSDFWEIAPTIWVRQSRAYAMNSIIALVGSDALLVDPGVTVDEIDTIADFLAAHQAQAHTIVLTHSHWDHILGANRFPSATLVTHADFPTIMHAEADHIATSVAAAAQEFGTHWPDPILPTATPTQLVPANPEAPPLTLSPWNVQLIPVPGHAMDQIGLLFPQANLFFAADMLSDIENPFLSRGDLYAYLDTLQRVESHLNAASVTTLLPGHGGPARGWPAIQARIHRDRRYLEALDERIRAVIAADGDERAAHEACADIPLLPGMAPEHHNNIAWHLGFCRQHRRAATPQ